MRMILVWIVIYVTAWGFTVPERIRAWSKERKLW